MRKVSVKGGSINFQVATCYPCASCILRERTIEKNCKIPFEKVICGKEIFVSFPNRIKPYSREGVCRFLTENLGLVIKLRESRTPFNTQTTQTDNFKVLVDDWGRNREVIVQGGKVFFQVATCYPCGVCLDREKYVYQHKSIPIDKHISGRNLYVSFNSNKRILTRHEICDLISKNLGLNITFERMKFSKHTRKGVDGPTKGGLIFKQMVGKAILLMKDHHHDIAIENLTSIVSLFPNVTEGYITLGTCLRMSGLYERAISVFNKAENLDPDNMEIYYQRSQAYLYFGRGDEDVHKALCDVQKAISLDSKFYRAVVLKGEIFLKMKDLWRSLSTFDEAVSLNGSLSRGYTGRAVVQELLGNLKKSAEDFEMAVKFEILEHKMPSILIGLGRVYRKLKQYKKSVAVLKRVMDFDEIYTGRKISVLSELGEISFENEKVIEAFEFYNEALKECKTASDLVIVYKSYYKFLGKIQPAVALDCYSKLRRIAGEKAVYFDFEFNPDTNGVIQSSRERLNEKLSLCGQKILSTTNNPLEEDLHQEEVMSLRTELVDVTFDKLTVFRSLGSGVYGCTYLCGIHGKDGVYVMKLFKLDIISEEISAEVIEKDCLIQKGENKGSSLVRTTSSKYLPYHRNVVSILAHKKMGTVKIHCLPDYLSSWFEEGFDYRTITAPWILMKFYPNDLDNYISKRKEGWDVMEIALVLLGILEGVKFLHEKMIVHRDLHPGNIFLNERIW